MDVHAFEVEAIQSAIAKYSEQVCEQLAQLEGVMMGGGTGDITLG